MLLSSLLLAFSVSLRHPAPESFLVRALCSSLSSPCLCECLCVCERERAASALVPVCLGVLCSLFFHFFSSLDSLYSGLLLFLSALLHSSCLASLFALAFCALPLSPPLASRRRPLLLIPQIQHQRRLDRQHSPSPSVSLSLSSRLSSPLVSPSAARHQPHRVITRVPPRLPS